MPVNTRDDLINEHCVILINGLQQLISVLPKIAGAVREKCFNEIIESYLEIAKKQADDISQLVVRNVDNDFESSDKGMNGLIKQLYDILAEEGNPRIREIALGMIIYKSLYYFLADYHALFIIAHHMKQKQIEQKARHNRKEINECKNHFVKCFTGSLLQKSTSTQTHE